MPHVLAQDLRNAVLQAALQGKLTEYIPTDSNIDDYYNDITSKRTQLIKDKQLKDEKCLSDKTMDEPFDIPENWKWCYLGECIQLTSGSDLTPDKYNDKGRGTVYITGASNIENGKIIINRWTEYPRSMANKGDLLLTCKGTIGTTCFLNIEKAHIARQIMGIRPIGVEMGYIYIFIQYYVNQLKTMAKSIIPGIERKNVLTAIFPLPPIEEQARIVARADELMAKIDEYEKIEKELVSLHKAFPGNMKDAILQAAMQGKLTEQLESDSNAIKLAELIKQERSKFSKNKYITDSVEELDIPDNWTWIKSGDCFSLEKGEKVSGVKLPYLEAKYLRGKNNPTYYESGEMVKKGTKVILVDGENSGEVFTEPEDGIIGSTFKVLFIPKSINEKFALYFLDMNRDNFRNNKKGAAIPHLSKELFNDLQMPIPPIEEQQRIVEKLDLLLPLCEELDNL